MTTRSTRTASKLIKIVCKIRDVCAKWLFILTLTYSFIGALYLTLNIGLYLKTHRFDLQSPIEWSLKVKSPLKISEIKNVDNSAFRRDLLHEQGGDTKEAGQSAVRGTKTLNLNTSEKDVVMALAHGSILWKQYQLETGRGKADFCRLEGKGFGGWGVKDDKGIHCYDTFKEASERAEYWLTKNLARNNNVLAVTLCQWSGHGEISSCDYYQNFLTL